MHWGLGSLLLLHEQWLVARHGHWQHALPTSARFSFDHGSGDQEQKKPPTAEIKSQMLEQISPSPLHGMSETFAGLIALMLFHGAKSLLRPAESEGFDLLPADLLVQIAGLADKQDVAQLAITCRTFHDKLSQQTQRELHASPSAFSSSYQPSMA